MKKITLLVLALIGFSMGVTAAERAVLPRPVRIADAEPVVFVERGVEFFVFADGQFDFNTRPATSGGIYYKNTRRSFVNNTYGAPGVAANSGVRVEHDEFGRVRRIGNVFVNYDAQNRIKRIGSVYMTYNRYALSQVGGLRIKYDARGFITGFSGSVNGSRPTYGNSYESGYNQGNNGYNNPPVDEDYYYYKTDGTKAKLENDIK